MAIMLLSEDDGVLEFACDDFNIFYNQSNGIMITIKKDYLPYKDIIFARNNFMEERIMNERYSKVIICVNISSACNLRCKYCFNKEKDNRKLDFVEIKKFIDNIVEIKDDAEKYFVDLAGSGEPLLHIRDVLKIADYCQEVSNRIGKEVTPMLSTNGLLLTPRMVSLLQKHGVLFGVSIDGYKKLHDKYRVDMMNNVTFDSTKNNVLKIRHNDYVGGSMTIVDSDTDILKAYIEMSKLFKTISIRPCRMSYDTFDFAYIKKGYSRFIDYLIKETLSSDYTLLYSILNGDDMLGKTILKVMSNSKLNRRCDAGVARFALGVDGSIYPCSPASFHEELKLTLNQIQNNDNNSFFKCSLDKCYKCMARSICGGECYVQSYEESNNDNLCDFKKHIFTLSLYFCGKIEIENINVYNKIITIANEIIGRNRVDKELHDLFNKCSDKYTFTELKKIKDNNMNKYRKILHKYMGKNNI